MSFKCFNQHWHPCVYITESKMPNGYHVTFLMIVRWDFNDKNVKFNILEYCVRFQKSLKVKKDLKIHKKIVLELYINP